MVYAPYFHIQLQETSTLEYRTLWRFFYNTDILLPRCCKPQKRTYVQNSPFGAFVREQPDMLVLYSLAISTVLVQILHWLGVNIFRIIVLLGTFSLAMAFAGNDLVNFIGVPLAGLESYLDFSHAGAGVMASTHKNERPFG